MKLVTVVGARPQFIKAAPMGRVIAKRRGIRHVLIHTGQHYDFAMSDLFFRDLELPEPDYNLDVGSGSHADQTGEMLKRIEPVLLQEKPDAVLVFGDTNSTLAGALAAAKIHIPVAHVEAGLRSFNRRMPEEINRVLTDHLAEWLFCPTRASVQNLEREGVTRGVHHVGDVMYDAMETYLPMAGKKSGILKQLGLQSKKYLLATVHRPDHTDQPEVLSKIMKALAALAQGGRTVVLPAHPRLRKQLDAGPKTDQPSLRIIDPVSYLDMLVLEKHAGAILTDSGGVQKEAFWMRVPCVTLRDETEWVETVESGWNVLAGTETEKIVEAAETRRAPRGKDESQYGDGHACERIVDILTQGK